MGYCLYNCHFCDNVNPLISSELKSVEYRVDFLLHLKGAIQSLVSQTAVYVTSLTQNTDLIKLHKEVLIKLHKEVY